MRILAAFAFSFAAAIFGAVYGKLDALLLPLGGALALAAVVIAAAVRRKSRGRARAVLILSGLAAGFLWTALYMAVFFQPAKDLDNQTVRLTATETKIIDLLMRSPGRIFPAEEIYRRVWEAEPVSPENTVMVHIRHIREKIELNPKEPEYLKVVWGIGYKMEKM